MSTHQPVQVVPCDSPMFAQCRCHTGDIRMCGVTSGNTTKLDLGG